MEKDLFKQLNTELKNKLDKILLQKGFSLLKKGLKYSYSYKNSLRLTIDFDSKPKTFELKEDELVKLIGTFKYKNKAKTTYEATLKV